MYRKVMLNCIFGISVFTLLGTAAFASHSNYGGAGSFYTKGVGCIYQASGTGKSPTTGICQVGTDDALLLCINQGENPVSNVTAIQDVALFGEGSAGGVGTTVRGRSLYDVQTQFDGTAGSDAECDASPLCNDLRQHCTSAQWVPKDVVPLTFCGVFTVFECLSAAACPCDPEGVTGPLCADHEPKIPGINPLGPPDKVYCELPNPETFEFGETRFYDCVAATPALCPDFF